MKEIWKPVVGYEGVYEVSNLGRVKSLPRWHENGRCGYMTKGKILKQRLNKGYLCVTLIQNNKRKHCDVHRLVAKAFIPNPNNYPCVNHKDENPNNPRWDNLEWCTVAYNNSYGTKLERQSKATSKKVYQYSLDGELIKIWNSVKECTENGFQGTHVSGCCLGKGKTHKNFIWSYKPLKTINKSDYISSVAPKKVYQYTLKKELVKIWNSIYECREGGFYPSSISCCCNKKEKYKTHKGYIWSYEPITK